MQGGCGRGLNRQAGVAQVVLDDLQQLAALTGLQGDLAEGCALQ